MNDQNFKSRKYIISFVSKSIIWTPTTPLIHPNLYEFDVLNIQILL